MIQLVHARDLRAARKWLENAQARLIANPVPLLVVGVSASHGDLRPIVEANGITGTFYIDVSGAPVRAMELGDQVLVLDDRAALKDAAAFIARARRATQRLDILLVEDVDAPDVTWCGSDVERYEAWV